jgi:hypothetical protein
MNNHGSLFFVQAWQQRTFEYGFFGCLLGFAAIAVVWRNVWGDQPRHSERLAVVVLLVVFAAGVYMFWPAPR